MSKELCLLLALGAAYTLAQSHEAFRVKFQWNYINYTWPSAESYTKAKEDGSYVEGNNIISGIKAYKDRIYLTIPRLKSGVPVTLASINATAIDGNTNPLLEPFPNWDMQKLGDCRALQFVQNVEIDPKGRMWVLDCGRVMNVSGESTERRCGASLRIFDLESSGTWSNKQLRSFSIPEAVADPRTAHLYDIVLDHEDGGMAYISDADPQNPGIIVFSLQNRTFWKVSHDSMSASNVGLRFIVETYRGHQGFSLNASIHGLALSPASTAGNRTLYYSPMSSLHMYSISTHVLKNKTLHADIDSHVVDLGRKGLFRGTQSDAMVVSNTGVLYFGDLHDDAISIWDSRQSSLASGQRIISRDHYLMQWPASFGFDNNGIIWCITNRMNYFLSDLISIREPNFRAIAAKVSYTNYQYLEDGSVPPLPEITYSGAGSLSFNVSLALTVLLMYFVF